MNLQGLTTKQASLLTFIADSEQTPSFEEMRQACGLASKSGIHRLLQALEERGRIRRIPNRARAIEVVEDGTFLPPPPSLSAFHTADLVVELANRGWFEARRRAA